MLAKRPTKQIRSKGINLNIVKGCYGFTPINPRFKRQRSTTYKTSAEAVREVIGGFRPINLSTNKSEV